MILIDAGNGLYGTDFHDALTERTELGWLLSYAGFLDMAIVTGTAVSHGIAGMHFSSPAPPPPPRRAPLPKLWQTVC